MKSCDLVASKKCPKTRKSQEFLVKEYQRHSWSDPDCSFRIGTEFYPNQEAFVVEALT